MKGQPKPKETISSQRNSNSNHFNKSLLPNNKNSPNPSYDIISSRINNEELKGKKLLCPLSNRKKTIEKIEIECDIDKNEDKEYIESLSANEKSFYETKASVIFNFLKDIDLARYIDDFIQDGFEKEEDLLLIKEDYFTENQVFNPIQQKKILAKVNELEHKRSLTVIDNNVNIIQAKPKKETCEFGINTNEDDNSMTLNSIIQRCWNCYKEIKFNSGINKSYNNNFIMGKLAFCGQNCMDVFEQRVIFAQCEECKKTFDKAKGDLLIGVYHYCSTKCRDAHLSKTQNNMIIHDNDDEDNNYKLYDPMEDF